MLTPITDTYGNLLAPSTEPHPGSVVMTDGEWGTAWQRHFATGLWHPTRGTGGKPWSDLLKRRNLVLVYAASPRPDNQHSASERPLSANVLGLAPVEVHTWATGKGN